MRISVDKDLKGRAVIDNAGRAIGAVDDVLVDGRSWRLEAFAVKLRGDAADELDLGHGPFRSAHLVVPIEMVHAAGDAVILNVPVAALRELKAAREADAPGP